LRPLLLPSLYLPFPSPPLGFKERNRLRREYRRRQVKREEAVLSKQKAEAIAQDAKHALMVKHDFAQAHFDLAIGAWA
jgi:hypothetical protein